MEKTVNWLKANSHFFWLVLGLIMVTFNTVEMSRKSRLVGIAKKEATEIRIKANKDSADFELRLQKKQSTIDTDQELINSLNKKIKDDSLYNAIGKLTIIEQSNRVRAIIAN